ncbi:hypothetical protein VP01_81g5 [Puccinia sorghi]|uniref:Tc1-like transposase DDE domain-containing protein n=1 Tax=Puccinia sorghi TaxID=27349 RepID=A0A0L6UAT9_9BASI|nr:hypothetical protein VP01_81g5 [Puccinia sorghi]
MNTFLARLHEIATATIKSPSKTGTTATNRCNFLVRLQDHSAESIIVMDNTRIHGGDNFERVRNLLKESSKKIKIKFLPKYSPFLNPLSRHNEEVEALEDKIESHSWDMQDIYKRLVSTKSASTSLKKLATNTKKKSTAKNQSSIQWRPHQPISGKMKKTHLTRNIQKRTTPAQLSRNSLKMPRTWKTVTPIPQKWNEAAFLQQPHDYVLNRVTSIGQKPIFIDESGFNSQTHPLHGYLLTVQATVLKTNSRGIMNNLVGEMSEDVMIYFELLNKDGKRKTGTTATKICNLLKIKIKFLPKYFPFLNPIKLAFNIINIDVKHKDILLQHKLAEAIQDAIHSKMSLENVPSHFCIVKSFT